MEESDLGGLDEEVALVEVWFGAVRIKKKGLIRFGRYKEYFFAY